jgi:hypothetical protein
MSALAPPSPPPSSLHVNSMTLSEQLLDACVGSLF